MAENLNKSENALEAEGQYSYGGFSSYDPNMCTTAARFSPFYGKGNATQSKENTQMPYKNLIYVQSSDIAAQDGETSRRAPEHSKTVNPSYLGYNNEILQAGAEVFVANQIEDSVAYSAKEEEASVLGVGIDYIQQIDQGIDEVTGEPITAGIVLHRSPNGHLYQNFYVTNEDGTPGQIVELVPIDTGNTNRLQEIEQDNYAMEPYGFPTECNMETLEAQLVNEQPVVEDEEEQNNALAAAQILEREQQRILLESTMSPLLAAVNDITQRDAELLSYLNQHVEKEHIVEQRVNNVEEEYTSRLSTRIERESSDDDDDYILVSDKPVESRARATLPTNYLYLGPVCADTNEPSVYAKRAIPQRTKFGPFEGEIRFTSDIFLNILRSQQPRHYPLLLVGKTRVLIVTNENTSNWMRFVRLAQSYAEQNLQIIEEGNRIYFKCNRDIHPKEELRVGYHNTYADKYYLPILEPSMEDARKKYELNNPWACYECDQRFPTSQDMQKHLEVHDVEDASCIISKRKIKRKRKKFKKLSELPKNSSRCLICFKVFMTNASLRKHFATHLPAKKSKVKNSAKLVERSTYKCEMCNRKFSSQDKLKSHEESHSANIDKPHKCPHCAQQCSTPTALAAHIRSHTNRLYSCVYCQQTFKYVMDFRKHVVLHCTDGVYSCIHCKKKYKEYHLVRKHVRIFHPAVKYPCNECDRLFLHMSFLRRHKATHAKKMGFKCSECDKLCRSKQELKHHIKTTHKVRRKVKKQAVKTKIRTTDGSSKNVKRSPKKCNLATATPPSEDDQQYQFKCEECRLFFKRRGMLVNHMAKRHPERNIDMIDELNQPIIKLQTVFNCPYCPKVYKNNAKRKAHILKNHPGMEVPPSFRSNQTVGCIKADVQKCQLCYKQYASRTRLLIHYRMAHKNEKPPEISLDVPPTRILIEEQCTEPVVMDIYSRPPVSPENKLLKLSSAALELSSIEDRKYFTDIAESKIVESEFGETSSNTELNRLPELFEESIGCI